MLGAKRALVVAAALLLLAAQPAQAYMYYEPSPYNLTVGISRPTISQQFTFAPGETFAQVTMTLDGQPVAPQTNNTTQTLSFTPGAPLAPGVHPVHLEVQVTHPRAAQGYYYNPLVEDFTVTVAAGAISALPQPDDAARRALDRVNQYRRLAGLAPVAFNASLLASAQRHARYMDTNGQYSHGEQPGYALYFGQDSMERDVFFGYTGHSVAEDIHEINDVNQAVDDWITGPYHRSPILDPSMTDLGFGTAGTYSALELGGNDTPSNAVVLWPYPGQTGVATQWQANEFPDPLRLYPGAQAPVGTAISLQFGTQPKSLSLTTATLTPAGGASVPLLTYSPANDSHLDNMVFVMARQPMQPSTTYSVHLAGSVDLGKGPQAYDRTWSFTTRADGQAPDLPAPPPPTPTPTPPAPPGNPTVTLPPATLWDIHGHWAEQQIRKLVASGAVAGYPDGSFRPDAHLTRAAFVKMLVAGAHLKLQPGATAGFTDVAGHWATQAGYLGAAAGAGLIAPWEYPAGAFHPDQDITREEIAQMLIRSQPDLQSIADITPPLAGDTVTITATGAPARTFTDGASWQHSPEISTAISAGLVSGYREADGTYTFRPRNRATRAEAAVMLVRLLSRT